MKMSGWSRKRFRSYFTVGLVIFNVVLLLVVLSDMLRGEADSYHNQHARLLAGAISGMLLSLGFLAKSFTAKGWLLAAAVASLSIGIVLTVR